LLRWSAGNDKFLKVAAQMVQQNAELHEHISALEGRVQKMAEQAEKAEKDRAADKPKPPPAASTGGGSLASKFANKAKTFGNLLNSGGKLFSVGSIKVEATPGDKVKAYGGFEERADRLIFHYGDHFTQFAEKLEVFHMTILANGVIENPKKRA
jgi:hypothetical protein